MLNQAILVGKLQDDPKIIEQSNGAKKLTITLDIQRAYKSPETDRYETDAVPITLWDGIAENTVEFCKKGATVGVKARLQVSPLGSISVVGEKVTFINTKGDLQ